MSFQLVDLTTVTEPPVPRVLLGCVLRNADGSFFASDGEEVWSGSGVPQIVPGGRIWIVNANFTEIQSLRTQMANRNLRANHWLRTPIETILSDWGLPSQSTETSARTAATLLNRVFSLVGETVSGQQKGRTNWSSEAGGKPSLATAIADIMGSDRTDYPKPIVAAKGNGYKTGAHVRNGQKASGDNQYRFQASRIGHAKQVLMGGRPSPDWKAVQLTNDDPQAFLAALSGQKGHVLVKVDGTDGVGGSSLPVTQKCWFTTTRGEPRFWLTGDEFRALANLDGFRVTGAFFTPAEVRPSPYDEAFRTLLDVLGSNFDKASFNLASMSWSAGLVAENLLAAATRLVKETPEFSGVDYQGRDRALTEKRARLLNESGVSVVSYYMGGVVVEVPDDAEAMLLAADAAWRAGLLLPQDFVETGRRLNVPMAGRNQDWGGAPEDVLLARLHANGMVKARWAIDSILDLPADRRPAAFLGIVQKLLGK